MAVTGGANADDSSSTARCDWNWPSSHSGVGSSGHRRSASRNSLSVFASTGVVFVESRKARFSWGRQASPARAWSRTAYASGAAFGTWSGKRAAASTRSAPRSFAAAVVGSSSGAESAESSTPSGGGAPTASSSSCDSKAARSRRSNNSPIAERSVLRMTAKSVRSLPRSTAAATCPPGVNAGTSRTVGPLAARGVDAATSGSGAIGCREAASAAVSGKAIRAAKHATSRGSGRMDGHREAEPVASRSDGGGCGPRSALSICGGGSLSIQCPEPIHSEAVFWTKSILRAEAAAGAGCAERRQR